MKTAFTPPLQFSGYPLKIAEPICEKRAIFPRIDMEKIAASCFVEKNGNLMDAPDNWDEAWFANYE